MPTKSAARIYRGTPRNLAMLARRLPGILPPLDDDEALEVTRIHSVAGMLQEGSGLVRMPPFRAPHHSASTAAIVASK